MGYWTLAIEEMNGPVLVTWQTKVDYFGWPFTTAASQLMMNKKKMWGYKKKKLCYEDKDWKEFFAMIWHCENQQTHCDSEMFAKIFALAEKIRHVKLDTPIELPDSLDDLETFAWPTLVEEKHSGRALVLTLRAHDDELKHSVCHVKKNLELEKAIRKEERAWKQESKKARF